VEMDQRLVGAISLPDGTVVRGRGRREPLPTGPLPQFGLYLGRPPDQPRRRFGLGGSAPWRPDWAAEWIDWPDFRTPRDDQRAAELIEVGYRRARAGERVEVACGGGIGRTGTVIACMAVLAGYPAADAVGWTRRHYRPRAVETPGQRRWIAWFTEHGRPIPT
jgi:Protein-tyrosine phosphatase